MITTVGVLGSGKIAARYPASVEPASNRRVTARASNGDFNYTFVSSKVNVSSHEPVVTYRFIGKELRLPPLTFRLAVYMNA